MWVLVAYGVIYLVAIGILIATFRAAARYNERRFK